MSMSPLLIIIEGVYHTIGVYNKIAPPANTCAAVKLCEAVSELGRKEAQAASSALVL
jgi:hypothetical protein